MKSRGIIAALLVSMAMGSCASAPNRCGNRDACRNDPNCKCWCSQGCGYRSKQPNDTFVYIENDPNGKHCYCKQWDIDVYEDNCIRKANIKQGKGAR